MSDSGYVSLAEVGRELSVSYWTARRWATEGLIKCIRLPSGTLRVPREELERVKAAELGSERKAVTA